MTFFQIQIYHLPREMGIVTSTDELPHACRRYCFKYPTIFRWRIAIIAIRVLQAWIKERRKPNPTTSTYRLFRAMFDAPPLLPHSALTQNPTILQLFNSSILLGIPIVYVTDIFFLFHCINVQLTLIIIKSCESRDYDFRTVPYVIGYNLFNTHCTCFKKMCR